jgi:hypothetical protein
MSFVVPTSLVPLYPPRRAALVAVVPGLPRHLDRRSGAQPRRAGRAGLGPATRAVGPGRFPRGW